MRMLALLASLPAMVREDFERFRKAKMRAAMLYAAAALLGLTAYACLVTALVLWVARHIDPVIAAAVAAAGFIVLAGIILAVVAAQNRAEHRRTERRKELYASTVRSAATTAMIGMAMRPKTLAAGAALLIAGLAFGLLKGNGRDYDDD
jgi:hypothetical protein